MMSPPPGSAAISLHARPASRRAKPPVTGYRLRNPLHTREFQHPVHHSSLPVTTPGTRRRRAATVRRPSPLEEVRAENISRPRESAADRADEVVHDNAYRNVFAGAGATVLDLDGAVGKPLPDDGNGGDANEFGVLELHARRDLLAV